MCPPDYRPEETSGCCPERLVLADDFREGQAQLIVTRDEESP